MPGAAKILVAVLPAALLILAYLGLYTTLGPIGAGAPPGIEVSVYPGSNVTGYQPLLIIVKGVNPDVTRVCVKAVFKVKTIPEYFAENPFIEKESETGVFCLKPVKIKPLEEGGATVFVVPGAPTATLLFNISSLNVINAKYLIYAWVYVNVTVGDKVVYRGKVYYRPVARSTPLPLLLNTSSVYLLDTRAKPVFCAAVLHGLPLRNQPVLVLRFMPSGVETPIAPSVKRSVPQLIELAEEYNKSVETLLESFKLIVNPDSIRGLYDVQPGLDYYCFKVDLEKYGFGPNANMLIYLRVVNVTSDPVAVYPRGSGPKTLIVDTGLPYALQMLNPELTGFEKALQEWGLWNASISWARMHRTYSKLYHYILSVWDYTPLPYWGYVTSLTNADIVVSVRDALEKLGKGSYSIVILSGWWFKMPLSWQTLVKRVALLALEGRVSVIATGLSLSRLALGRDYLGSPLPMDYVYGGVISSAAASLGARLYSSLATVNETLALALENLPAPAFAPVKASMRVTMQGFLELGFAKGYSVTLDLPLDSRLKKLGYRGYGSLSWLPLYLAEPSYIEAVLGDKTLWYALKMILENLTSTLPVEANKTLLLEALDVLAGTASSIISSLVSGMGTNTGVLANATIDSLGVMRLEASYPPLGLRLYSESPGLRILLVGDDAIIVELPLCNGRRILYSSVPLEIDKPLLIVSGPSLLARLVQLAAKRFTDCTLFQGVPLESRVAGILRSIIGGDIVVGIYTEYLPLQGFVERLVCTGSVKKPELAIVVSSNASLIVSINGSRVEPILDEGLVKIYRLRPGCQRVIIKGDGGLIMPTKLYIIVYGGLPTVATETVTTTVTATTTVYRNVTVPIIVYKNVTSTVTVTRVVEKPVTRTLVVEKTRTVTTLRVVNKTITRLKPISIVVTTTVNRFITRTVSTTMTIEKNITLYKTRTVTSISTIVLKSVGGQVNNLLYIAVGLAAGAALGYLVPRFLSRL